MIKHLYSDLYLIDSKEDYIQEARDKVYRRRVFKYLSREEIGDDNLIYFLPDTYLGFKTYVTLEGFSVYHILQLGNISSWKQYFEWREENGKTT